MNPDLFKVALDTLQKGVETLKKYHEMGKWQQDTPEQSPAKPEWEILSFKEKRSGILYYLQPNGSYWINSDGPNGLNLQTMLTTGRSVKDGAFFIHSVKRLSDNTVWTVGEEATKGSYNAVRKILKFELNDGYMSAIMGYDTPVIKYSLDMLTKPDRKIIFISADGVNIYDGQVYFVVSKDWLINSFTASLQTKRWPYLKDRSFSTKEAAEKYVLFNKPLFSGLDVYKVIVNNIGTVGFSGKPIMEQLNEMAKEKINYDRK